MLQGNVIADHHPWTSLSAAGYDHTHADHERPTDGDRFGSELMARSGVQKEKPPRVFGPVTDWSGFGSGYLGIEGRSNVVMLPKC